jgi:hypothetical protein
MFSWLEKRNGALLVQLRKDLIEKQQILFSKTTIHFSSLVFAICCGVVHQKCTILKDEGE